MAGSIERRGKDSWRLVVSAGTGPDGKQDKKTKTVNATSRREAEKLLAAFVVEVEKGLFIGTTKLTLAEFTQRWLRDYGETNLAPKTLYRYREMLNLRILPAMGHLKIEQIKPMHLLEFYKNLQEDGIRLDNKPGTLSDRTILHHHRLLCALFNDAVEWQVIPYNPAGRVKPPKVKKKQAGYYNEKQAGALLEALETEPLKYKVLVILALATGARRGEVMGLEWKDVNFETDTIEVRQVSQYLPEKGIFVKEPKNETSKRVISIPASVMDLLKTYRKEWLENRLLMGDLWQGSEMLFTSWDGKPMHPDTITSWFIKFLKRHNLPHIAFHALRHTSASLLIAEGVNLKSVSRRLGHSNISTTGDIYAHALRSVDQEAAAKLDNLFNGRKESFTKKQKQ